MKVEFYGLKSCDTCKKALKALAEAGREPVVTDVRADGVPETALAEWLDRAGVDALVNRRSTTWRGLSAEEQAEAMTEAGALALLKANPTLMKRPVIVAGDALHIGWTADAQAALL
ncbi:MAG: Spx/MgsR family RNA polymerase-binding regulatory protein [Pseudomonadota bacterium]